jgi:hypothetical protein
MTEQQVHAGAAVFDMAGEKIGLLQGYEARGDCAVIRTNTPVSACLHIPRRDIRGNDAPGGLSASPSAQGGAERCAVHDGPSDNTPSCRHGEARAPGKQSLRHRTKDTMTGSANG